MKYPKAKKYGSNNDERESVLPLQFEAENRRENPAK